MRFFHSHSFNQFNRGQAMLVSVIFFLFITMTIVFGVASPVINQVKTAKDYVRAKQTYILAEAGVEDVVYRLKRPLSVAYSETLSLNGYTTVTTITDTADGKMIVAQGNLDSYIRKVQVNLLDGTGVSFHYGIQVGNGGFELNGNSSSKVVGNVFSGGSVTSSGQGNLIEGDVISATASGLISGIHATGTAWAHSIQNSTIDKDAYYQSISGSTVSGANCTSNTHCHPGSADLANVDLPISDAQISEWESDAEAGGTMLSSQCDSYSSGTCTITSSKSLGPLKIPFNLLLKSSSGVLTVTGPLWVVGNITMQTGPTIRMDPALGNHNVAIIADPVSNRSTGGVIDVGQSSAFVTTGTAGSYVFLISQNNCAETVVGCSTDAISMSQSSSAAVAYASHGRVTLGQSINLKEVTAYKVRLTNSAVVTYDTGLPSTLFESGPSGGYGVTGWKEIQ